MIQTTIYKTSSEGIHRLKEVKVHPIKKLKRNKENDQEEKVPFSFFKSPPAKGKNNISEIKERLRNITKWVWLR